ncbi:MAG: hypothetical protein V4482_06495 [Pseudomonadota bacterium]
MIKITICLFIGSVFFVNTTSAALFHLGFDVSKFLSRSHYLNPRYLSTPGRTKIPTETATCSHIDKAEFACGALLLGAFVGGSYITNLRMKMLKEVKEVGVDSSFSVYSQENLIINEEDLHLATGFHAGDISVIRTLSELMSTFVNSGDHGTLPPGD